MATQAKTPAQFDAATTVLGALHFIGRMIFALFTGGTAVAIGETIEVDETAVVGLSQIPKEALWCIVTCQADDTSVNLSRSVRFSETAADEGGTLATWLDATHGMPLGDGGMIELTGTAMKKARFIGIEVGRTHTLNVQYYK